MKKRELKAWEIEMLEKGNTYAFAMLFFEFFPEDAKKYKTKDELRKCVEFNPDSKEYTFWDDEVKSFFNTKMECTGWKEY